MGTDQVRGNGDSQVQREGKERHNVLLDGSVVLGRLIQERPTRPAPPKIGRSPPRHRALLCGSRVPLVAMPAIVGFRRDWPHVRWGERFSRRVSQARMERAARPGWCARSNRYVAPSGEARDQAEAPSNASQRWIMTLLANLDAGVDEETKTKVLEGCGRGCLPKTLKAKAHKLCEKAGDKDAFRKQLGSRWPAVTREGQALYVV